MRAVNVVRFASAVGLTGILSACGFGDSDNTKTGVFFDSAVEGLRFETPSQSGTTNKNGEFRYKDNEQVTFYLGAIKLGTTKAGALLTPLSFFPDADDYKDSRVTNILRLLQTLDTDNNAENGITLPADLIPHTDGLTVDFTVPTLTFAQQDGVKQLLQDIKKNTALVEVGAAQVHFQNILREVDKKSPLFSISVTVENLNGTVVISNFGQDALTISNNGTYSFEKKYFDETGYSVNIRQQPVDQSCWVIDGVGEVNGKDIDLIKVTCGSKQQAFNGQVNGLRAGGELILGYGNARSPIAQNGPYSLLLDTEFPTPTPISVAQQPTGQYCEVLETTTKTTNERNIECHNLFRITGTINGVRVGTITVNYHIGEEVKRSVIASGSNEIVFDDNAVAGRLFKIDSIVSNTNREVCTWSGDNFTVNGLVDNIKINCVPKTYTVSLNVTGMASGRGDVKIGAVVGGASVTVPAISQNGTVTLASGVAHDANIALTLNGKPTSQACTFDQNNQRINANDLLISLNCEEIQYPIIVSKIASYTLKNDVLLRIQKGADAPIEAPLKAADGTISLLNDAVYGNAYTLSIVNDGVNQYCTLATTALTITGQPSAITLNCEDTYQVTINASIGDNGLRQLLSPTVTRQLGGTLTVTEAGQSRTLTQSISVADGITSSSLVFQDIRGNGTTYAWSGSYNNLRCATVSNGSVNNTNVTPNMSCVRLTPVAQIASDTAFRSCLTQTPHVYTEDVTQLSCVNKSLQNLNGIDYLGKLTTLDVADNASLDIGALNNQYTRAVLASLNAKNTGMTPGEWPTITSLTNLTILNVANNGLTAITGIDALTKLANINLSNNALTSITPLQNLTTVSTLVIDNNSVTFDLAPIRVLDDVANSTRLTSLSLANLPERPDQTITNAVANVSDGNLRSCITNHANYHDWVNTRDVILLECDGQSIGSLSGIEAFWNLRVLNISNNNGITGTDLNPLGNMTYSPLAPETKAKLEVLYANNIGTTGSNGSVNIAPVNRLTNLVYLDLTQGYKTGTLTSTDSTRTKNLAGLNNGNPLSAPAYPPFSSAPVFNNNEKVLPTDSTVKIIGTTSSTKVGSIRIPILIRATGKMVKTDNASPGVNVFAGVRFSNTQNLPVGLDVSNSMNFYLERPRNTSGRRGIGSEINVVSNQLLTSAVDYNSLNTDFPLDGIWYLYVNFTTNYTNAGDIFSAIHKWGISTVNTADLTANGL